MLTAFQIGPFPLLSTFCYFYPSQGLDPGFYRPLQRGRTVAKNGERVQQMKGVETFQKHK